MPDTIHSSYTFGRFRLDPVEKVLFDRDTPVALTPKAVETLLALVERRGRIVTKEELIRIVWPQTFVEENNLAQNISMLRRVLGDAPGGGQFIETIPKRGYRFTGTLVSRTETAHDVAAPAESSKGEGVQDGPEPAPVTAPVAPSASKPTLHPVLIAAGVAGAAVLAILIVLSFRAGRRPSGESAGTTHLTRLAVLPFTNLGAPDEQYFVAGMTEEIAGRLAGLRTLAIVSTTTTTAYDQRGKSTRQIGTDLGVEYIVEGSVRWARRAGDTEVRITPRLIRVTDDTAVWTQQYDAALSDIFAVQADIAYRIAGALQVALLAADRRNVDARPTADTEAYLAYLRAITLFQQAFSDTASQTQARAELEHAVSRDPRFALAWSALARVYAWQYFSGARRTLETKQLAQTAAETAMALDPGRPDVHLGRAQVYFMERDYDAVRRELDVVRDALPNSPDVWRMVGSLEQRQGHWIASRDAYMRAFDIDAASAAFELANHYMHMRQYADVDRFVSVLKATNRPTVVLPESFRRFAGSGDSATARRLLTTALNARSPADARVRGLLARFEWFDGQYQRALELIGQMDTAGAWLPVNFRFPASLAAGQVYESLGRREDAAKQYGAAIAELERRQRDEPDDYQIEAALGLAAAGLGHRADAIRHGERAVELLPITKDAAEGPLYLYFLAQIHARLGDAAAAFAVLDRMFSVPGFYSEIWIERDPGFASLRADPTFHAHVARWAAQKGEGVLVRKR